MKTLEEIKNSFREKFLTYTHWSSSNKSLSRLAKAEDVEDFLTQTYTSMVLAEVEQLEWEKLHKKEIWRTFGLHYFTCDGCHFIKCPTCNGTRLDNSITK